MYFKMGESNINQLDMVIVLALTPIKQKRAKTVSDFMVVMLKKFQDLGGFS